MASERLFDQSPRSDGKPGRHTEKPFHFLDRRAGALWDRVRNHLEICFAAFPEEHRRDLGSRLRDDDQRQHLPAWWELYIFTLFDRLGYTVEVHPELPGSSKNPDFLVTHGPIGIYVEAAVVFNDDLPSDAWNWVCDCVNEAKNPDFMVDLEFPTAGKHRPAKQKIIDPLEKWLATLDADQVLADYDAGRPLPHKQLPAGDWVLDYSAVPVIPERRRIVDGRMIAIYPIRPADFARDVEQLGKTLNKKGSKYSERAKPLDKSLVVAIATWNHVDEFELTQTLFGSVHIEVTSGPSPVPPRSFRKPDGYWRPGADPRGSRISALLFGDNMRAWSVASGLPDLWINPWPLNPAPPIAPFATIEVGGGGDFVRTDATTTAADLFGLSPEWPYRD
jgi:hypothetical protein